ncbi:MAG TPA: hypothetical protein PLV92_19105, partial [Pirellulaceae bacterium]|nr:hypothetical protein [Pirellulaceae bacterium]
MALLVVMASITALVIGISGTNDVTRTSGKPVLELDIPADIRGDVALVIDRQRHALSVDEPWSVALEPGPHSITLQRRGFKQIDHTFSLRA